MNQQLYSRINYVHSPDGELLRECPGIIKTMHTGLARTRIMHYANAPVLTRKKPDVCDLAWKDLCSVLNALSK